jgi:ribosomal protein S18 acetylase RimI-like enzyme
MHVVVRPATPEDPCVPLLFASARPYYVAYAGSERRALALLEAVYRESGHAASYACCRVATVGDALVGVMAGFPVGEGDRLARRFVQLTLPKLPPWRWPGTFRHLRAAGAVSPRPPLHAYYVDALAVDPEWRRRGIARRLLEDAEAQARIAGLGAVALDTGLGNADARALYVDYGFREREIRRAPSARKARAIGGPGFIGYVKAG